MLTRLLISLLLLLLPTFAGAVEIRLNDVVTALETPFRSEIKPSGQIHNFRADFLQKSHIVSIGKTQHGKGKVSFSFTTTAKDNFSRAKFRWEYLEPTLQEIISDGQTMWVYMPENRQVIESNIGHFDAQKGQNPVTFLSGLGNLSQNFLIAWDSSKTDRNGNYLLQLKPRQPSQFIQLIEIVVNAKAVNSWLQKQETGKIFPIKTTIVTDPQGNRTSIQFKNVNVNQLLAEKMFSFVRPAGVELVNPGKQMVF